MRDEYDFSKLKARKNPYVKVEDGIIINDTDYLLSNQANKEHIIKSINQYKSGKCKVHDLVDNN